jgi:3-dehydroquinate synthase
MKNKPIIVSVELGAARSYDILIGINYLRELPSIIKAKKFGAKIALITNPIINKLYGDRVVALLKAEGFLVKLIEVPDGETTKNIEQASQILDIMLAEKLERKDTVIALGGGVIGDLSGFIASIYLRGINLIQVPTTLLAQVDSSVGGKTAVNHAAGKNLIGTFYQPKLTYIDVDTLTTLPKREIYCGLAEVIKYGIICNKDFFEYIEGNKEKIKAMDIKADMDTWSYLIQKSCEFKAEVVSKDETEKGIRETLNFGHTFGHGVEAVFGYKKYLHGEAVAIGMKAASYVAANLGLITEADYIRVITLMLDLGFNLKVDGANAAEILEKMRLDKKVRNNKIRLVLPVDGIGKATTKDDVSESLVLEAIETIL